LHALILSGRVGDEVEKADTQADNGNATAEDTEDRRKNSFDPRPAAMLAVP